MRRIRAAFDPHHANVLLDYFSVTAWASYLWVLVAVCGTLLCVVTFVLGAENDRAGLKFADVRRGGGVAVSEQFGRNGMSVRLWRSFDEWKPDDLVILVATEDHSESRLAALGFGERVGDAAQNREKNGAVCRVDTPAAYSDVLFDRRTVAGEYCYPGKRILSFFALGAFTKSLLWLSERRTFGIAGMFGYSGVNLNANRWRTSVVFQLKAQRHRNVFPAAPIRKENWGTDSDRSLDPRSALNFGNASLSLHDAGLARVDTILQRTDYNQNDSKKYLDPVRGFQIPKPFTPLRWVCALVWLIGWLAAWFCAAFYAHKYKSGLLVIVALGLMFCAVMGSFFVLGFSENVSAAPGIDASATRYRGSEYIRVLSVVVLELKFPNVQGQILFADFVERADNATLEGRP